MNSLTNVMRHMAYMVVVGNQSRSAIAHVSLSDSKKDQLGNYSAYNARFRMPSPESGGVLNMCRPEGCSRQPSQCALDRCWYAPTSIHSSSCDANGVPNDEYESLKCQKAFEKLFIKYKVDLVYQGPRARLRAPLPTADSKAIMHGVSKDGKTYTNPKAPVHVIAGIAGNSEGLYPFKNPPSPKWLALMDNEHYDVTPSQACRVSDTSNEPAYRSSSTWRSLENKPVRVWPSLGNVRARQGPHGVAGSYQIEAQDDGNAKIETKSYYKDDDYELYSYHAVVSGLKANTDGDQSPFTIAVYGDLGVDDNSVASNKYVNSIADEVDFIYHVGDVAYADNAFLTAKNVFGFYYEQVYNKFMNSMTNTMRQVAYMVVVGNHEAECHSPTCLLSTAKRTNSVTTRH
ncbi:Metallo-dependent phosphatase-like [Phytophthora cactorum]|nr:Metallo-dependent phosphatase-like [Phytophthora cactorum]